MRTVQLSVSRLVAPLAVLALAGCGGGSSSDDVAACMQAMATISCPPGTAPTSRSSGNSATEASLGMSGASGSNEQEIGCQYECAAICMCGIDRVEADGAVVCSPCFGAEQRALTSTTSTPTQQPRPGTQLPPQGSPSGPVQNVNQQATVVLDFTSPPLFEHHTLTAPFQPDPFGVTVRAGGYQSIADANVWDETGSPCRGFVNAGQPDIAITYYSRGTPLLMSVNSEADTTLIVNMPDGTWRCNDDANESTLNPRLYFPEGQSGRYNIWVGTYQRDTSFPIAQFRATTRL